MWAYIVRRILLTIPIVLGIVLITFLLFSFVAKDPARAYVGKFVTEQQLESARARMGLNKPKWFDAAALVHGDVRKAFDTQLFDVLLFRFPNSMRYEEPLGSIIRRKAPASMAIQVPAFLIMLGLELALALWAGANRGRWADYT